MPHPSFWLCHKQDIAAYTLHHILSPVCSADTTLEYFQMWEHIPDERSHSNVMSLPHSLWPVTKCGQSLNLVLHTFSAVYSVKMTDKAESYAVKCKYQSKHLCVLLRVNVKTGRIIAFTLLAFSRMAHMYLLQFPQELNGSCSWDVRPVEEGEAAAVNREGVMGVRVLCRAEECKNRR